MTTPILRIATRQSPLALWQAEYVKQQLEHCHPGICVELVKFTTRGDKILDTPLAKIGGKGLFVKELEHALLAGEADIAVHSMKDVPMEFPDGLALGVICPRERFDSPHRARLAAGFSRPKTVRCRCGEHHGAMAFDPSSGMPGWACRWGMPRGIRRPPTRVWPMRPGGGS